MEDSIYVAIWLYVEWVISNFYNVIEYTYTLLVGFVAIGIPLAIQIAGQHSERYDNKLLSKRLVEGKLVTIPVIVICSVIYILLSLTYIQATSNNAGDFPLSQSVKFSINFSLALLFIFIILSSTIFYIRFYKRSTTQTHQYISAYLLISEDIKTSKISNISIKNLSWLKQFKRVKDLTTNIKNIYVRLVKKDITKDKVDSINAGLEVLIEQLKSKGWDSRFNNILIKFDRKISNAYLSKDQGAYPLLSNSDIITIKVYWDALVRIVKNSRRVEDSRLSFSSQRRLFGLMELIIFHPQYESIVSEPYDRGKKVAWTNDVYELARWQSNQKSKGIDLFLDGEWFWSMFSISSTLEFRNGFSGYTATLKLAIDIFEIILREKPEKIERYISEISNSIHYGDDENNLIWHPESHNKMWVLDFLTDLNRIDFSLANLEVIYEKINSLRNGDALRKYSNSYEDKPLSPEDINAISKKIDDIHIATHKYEVKKLGLELLSRLSYYEYWDKYLACLEGNQPRDSKTIYLNESVFPKSPSELFTSISSNYTFLHSNTRFIGNHEIRMYAYRAFFFHICFFIEKNENIHIHLPNEDSNKKNKNILTELLEQESYIRKIRFWKKEISIAVRYIRELIEQVDKREEKLILTSRLSKLDKAETELVMGWKSNFILEQILTIKYTKEICQKHHKFSVPIKRMHLVKNNDSNYSFSHEGQWLFKEFLNLFHDDLLEVALEENLIVEQMSDHLIFAPYEELTQMGFKREGNVLTNTLIPNSHAIPCEYEHILVVDKSLVKLNISMDSRFKGVSPLFFGVLDDNKETIHLLVDVYYKLLIQDASGIKFSKIIDANWSV